MNLKISQWSFISDSIDKQMVNCSLEDLCTVPHKEENYTSTDQAHRCTETHTAIESCLVNMAIVWYPKPVIVPDLNSLAFTTIRLNCENRYPTLYFYLITSLTNVSNQIEWVALLYLMLRCRSIFTPAELFFVLVPDPTQCNFET